MAGRTKSQLERKVAFRRKHNQLLARAAEAYKSAKKNTAKGGIGYRTICKEISDEHFRETGERIILSHATLRRHVEGNVRGDGGNDSRKWLTNDEETIVVDYLNDMAQRGFPYSQKRTAQLVNKIARERLGEKFPESGVGVNWTYRFTLRNSHRIKMWTSRPLEEKRGRGANPNTNKHWWELLESVLRDRNISPQNIYGTDEVGVQAQGQGERERVYGPLGSTAPYQQRAGDRENITLIATICADGTSIPPTVIFKGKAHQIKWVENNPLKASIGYQRKGWTDGEIGAEWIKLFDNATRPKLASRDEWRLLILDGHNSHHTLEFLEHAIENNIEVLCYPAHVTHLYQGLDVVVFGVFKYHMSQERDKLWFEKGEVIDKSNFLEVLEKPWIKTFTEPLIKKAFEKTGIVPFNPNVITPEQLAPSKESSCVLSLPGAILDEPSITDPIEIVTKMLIQLRTSVSSSDGGNLESAPDVSSRGTSSDLAAPAPPPIASTSSTISVVESQPSPPTPSLDARTKAIHDAIDQLGQSDVGHLLDPTAPVLSTDPPPPMYTQTMPQVAARKTIAQDALTTMTPTTDNEVVLMGICAQQQDQIQMLERQVVKMQASNILQRTYADRIKVQLAFKERKGKKKADSNGTIDTNARILTAEESIEGVRKKREQQKAAEEARQDKEQARQDWAEAVKAWEKADTQRKADAKAARTFNKATRAAHAKQVAAAKKQGATVANIIMPPLRSVPKAVKKPLLKEFLARADPQGVASEDGDSSSSSSGQSSELDAADDDSDDD